MNHHPDSFRLTDELERELMLRAIDEQFRPQPLRALGKLARKLAHGLMATFAKSGAKNADSATA